MADDDLTTTRPIIRPPVLVPPVQPPVNPPPPIVIGPETPDCVQICTRDLKPGQRLVVGDQFASRLVSAQGLSSGPVRFVVKRSPVGQDTFTKLVETDSWQTSFFWKHELGAPAAPVSRQLPAHRDQRQHGAAGHGHAAPADDLSPLMSAPSRHGRRAQRS